MPLERLPRFLGPVGAALLTVGWTIGSAIFRVPGVVAAGSGSISASLALWVAGGVIALCGALCYAELSVRLPRAGSEYAFTQAAYHPLVAFLVAWSALFGAPAAVAAVARAFADYYAVLWPLEEFGRRFTAATAIVVLASIAVVSTPASVRVAGLAGVGKLLAALMIAVVGLAFVDAHQTASATPVDTRASLGPALVGILFAYDGFQAASFFAGEVRTPQRTLPIALFLGLGCIALTYVGLNVVYFRVLGFGGVVASDAVAAQTLSAAVGPRGAQVMAGLIMASTLGTLAAQTVGQPRYFYAPAEDGLFPSWMARLTTRASTPANAVVTLAVAAIALVATGGYVQLITIAMLVSYPMTALALVGAVRLRKLRGAPTGFSMPLYPLPLVVFVAGIAATCAAGISADPRALLYALGVPASGTLMYVVCHRQGPGSVSSTASGA